MKKNLNNQENCKDRKFLVLCEFLDGAWDSIRFSIQHLIRKKQGLVLVQAYQKPHTGQSLLNDFTGLQGKFARQELQKLKEKAVQSFDLDEQQIALCPFEGSWQSRITSYNVCYTKLLRLKVFDFLSKQITQQIIGQPAGTNAEQLSRITSYNVCYTKLLRLL